MENKPVEDKVIVEPVKDQVAETPPGETGEQINWREFRKQREIDRKHREEAEKLAAHKHAEAEALKAAMEAILNKKSSQSDTNNSQYSDEISDDEKIDRKVNQALEIRERQLDEQRKKKEQEEVPSKLNQAYKDFDKVCSAENVDYLEYHYPEVANAFKYAPDGFEKWSNVYNAIKRLVPNSDSKKDQKKAEQNFNKPQSMAVAGATQTGDTAPIYLDDKRKSDNWARMQRVRKGGK